MVGHRPWTGPVPLAGVAAQHLQTFREDAILDVATCIATRFELVVSIGVRAVAWEVQGSTYAVRPKANLTSSIVPFSCSKYIHGAQYADLSCVKIEFVQFEVERVSPVDSKLRSEVSISACGKTVGYVLTATPSKVVNVQCRFATIDYWVDSCHGGVADHEVSEKPMAW